MAQARDAEKHSEAFAPDSCVKEEPIMPRRKGIMVQELRNALEALGPGRWGLAVLIGALGLVLALWLLRKQLKGDSPGGETNLPGGYQ